MRERAVPCFSIKENGKRSRVVDPFDGIPGKEQLDEKKHHSGCTMRKPDNKLYKVLCNYSPELYMAPFDRIKICRDPPRRAPCPPYSVHMQHAEHRAAEQGPSLGRPHVHADAARCCLFVFLAFWLFGPFCHLSFCHLVVFSPFLFAPLGLHGLGV